MVQSLAPKCALRARIWANPGTAKLLRRYCTVAALGLYRRCTRSMLVLH